LITLPGGSSLPLSHMEVDANGHVSRSLQFPSSCPDADASSTAWYHHDTDTIVLSGADVFVRCAVFVMGIDQFFMARRPLFRERAW